MERSRFESAALKLLLAGAGIIMTCIIITVGIMNLKQGRNLANITANKMNGFAGELSVSEITMYDGLTVRGSDIVNFYKKHFGTVYQGDVPPFLLEVKTSLANYIYQDGTSLKLMRDAEAGNYIKPVKQFVGEVISNENKVIVKVIFTEKQRINMEVKNE